MPKSVYLRVLMNGHFRELPKSMYFFVLSNGREMPKSMHFYVLSSGRPFIQTVRSLGISSTGCEQPAAKNYLEELDMMGQKFLKKWLGSPARGSTSANVLSPSILDVKPTPV